MAKHICPNCSHSFETVKKVSTNKKYSSQKLSNGRFLNKVKTAWRTKIIWPEGSQGIKETDDGIEFIASSPFNKGRDVARL